MIRYRLPRRARTCPPCWPGTWTADELTLPSADVTADLALLVGWARDNHVDLTGLEVGSPSLEDAYLALTSEEHSTWMTPYRCTGLGPHRRSSSATS